MPLYNITLTRDLSESATVLIEASDIASAQRLAMEMDADDLSWGMDDLAGDIYVSGAALSEPGALEG